MWIYCTGIDSPPVNNINVHPPNIVRYDYQNGYSGQCVKNYLQAYQGYLQVDGYTGYGQTQAILVGCWTHARRKFIEAQKIQVKGKTGWAINHIKKLYRIEAGLINKTAIEKQSIRQAQSTPLLEQLKVWLVKSA